MNATESRAPQLPYKNDGALVRAAALQTIIRLQSDYQRDVPAAVAAVARLRREAGRDPYSSPGSWGLDDLADLSELREKQQRAEEKLQEGQENSTYLSVTARQWAEERAEQEARAVHLAVTLWALHQQSLREEGMNHQGWPLGRAARRLAEGKSGVAEEKKAGTTGELGEEASNEETGDEGAATRQKSDPMEDVSESVRKRFVRLGTSSDFDVLSDRLRQFVLLLHTARIPLDYGLLARQLFYWQDEFQQQNIRRAWGREFHLYYSGKAFGERQSEIADAAAEGPSADSDPAQDDADD